MTKDIFFDLDFTENSITAVSDEGDVFLRFQEAQHLTRQTTYRDAINQGLHVRFENTTVRDSVTAA